MIWRYAPPIAGRRFRQLPAFMARGNCDDLNRPARTRHFRDAAAYDGMNNSLIGLHAATCRVPRADNPSSSKSVGVEAAASASRT